MESDEEKLDWEADVNQAPLTSDEKKELLARAMEQAQRCHHTCASLQEGYLEDDHRTYRRIMRLELENDEDKGGVERGFIKGTYTLKGFSVTELDRLEKQGFNIRADDVVYQKGVPSWVFRLQPCLERMNAKEKKKYNQTLKKGLELYAAAVELERKKRTQRPVEVDPANLDKGVTLLPNPPPTQAEIDAMAKIPPTKRL